MNVTVPMLLVSTAVTALAPRGLAQEPDHSKAGTRRLVDVSVEGLEALPRRSPENGGVRMGLSERRPTESTLPFDCLESIADQATGSCLTASSTPTMGRLYPYPGLNNTFVPQAFVGGGEDNRATGPWSQVGGGHGNFSTARSATIGGGYKNTASSDFTTVGGGSSNQATASYSTVGGGKDNTAAGYTNSYYGFSVGYATVAGGGDNEATERLSTIGGGFGNTASGTGSTIGGGRGNTASGNYATVGGGGALSPSRPANTASGNFGTIGGGSGNTASGSHATVGSGYANTASGKYATVGGGRSNSAVGSSATIGAGSGNRAAGPSSAIAGGASNVTTGAAQAASIGGGYNNQAFQPYATVGGGRTNIASATYATIGGGRRNSASGQWSAVPGGEANTAAGGHSFAAGRQAKANHDGAFVWGDGYASTLKTSSAPDEFSIYCSGGARFFSNSAASTGVLLAPGGSTWTMVSDRNAKENIEPVDARAVLDRVAELPLSTWNYKAQDDSIRHMGPMAQDFYAAFGLGLGDRTIDTIDPNGVALAAIQGLNELMEENEQRLARKDAEIEDLRKQVAALTRRIDDLASSR